MPDARCSFFQLQRAMPVDGGAPRLQLFFESILEHLNSKHRIGIHLFELAVFLLKRFESLSVFHVHHPEFFAPTVQRGYRDLLLLAELFLAQVTRVTFTQEDDDFFGLVSFLSVHFCRIWL